ncbi:MAG: hypothetical protein ACRD44_14475 [Bryobacteraceae bacterium]
MKAGLAAVMCLAAPALFSQVIEFESGGLKYLTQTRNGMTIMFAHVPSQVRDYSIVMVAVSNGSTRTYSVKPTDFDYVHAGGAAIEATPPRRVIAELLDKAGRNDVIKLVTTYESTLYGAARNASTNGYEQRRQAHFAEGGGGRIKAAAAASAIAFVETKLPPGASQTGRCST